jgi:DNA-binding NarL/FixJ family response regulator
VAQTSSSEIETELSEALYAAPAAKRRVTDRELEILQLLADGHENNEIARRLYISLETVKTHVRRLLKKLGARSRTHAVAIALRQKLVE